MNYARKAGLTRSLFVMFLLIAGISIVCCWFFLIQFFFPNQSYFLGASTIAIFVAVYFFSRPMVMRTWIVQCPVCEMKSASLKYIGDDEFLICDQCRYKEKTGITLGSGGDV